MKGFLIVCLLMLFGSVVHQKIEKQDFCKEKVSVAAQTDVPVHYVAADSVEFKPVVVPNAVFGVSKAVCLTANDTKAVGNARLYRLCYKKIDPGRWV